MKGEFEKLMIVAYDNPKFTGKKTGKMLATINPEQLQEKYENKFSKKQAENSIAAELKFQYGKPQKFDFKLIFDGTGVLSNAHSFGTDLRGAGGNQDVTKQIEELKKLTIEYEGSKHEPRYLQIVWGTRIFQGRVTNLDITYTLFKPNGEPIRAQVLLSIQGSVEQNAEAAMRARSSPDLTHVRTIPENESLPYLTHKIYGDSIYYLEVARVNKMAHFRRLGAGSKLSFPPLDKTING